MTSAAPGSQPRQNVLFIRFAAMNMTVLATALWLLFYPPVAILGLAAGLALDVILDERIGDTRRNFGRGARALLDATLFAMLPLIAFLALCHATVLSDGDPFGIGALTLWLTGHDILSRRDSLHGSWKALASVPAGVLYGAAAINVAHELFHRLQSKASVITGRWLLAFSWDTTFAIEHVYGHHRNVGTLADPATARRGETYYRFLLRSTTSEIANGFKLEASRLRNRKRPVWSWNNRALRGQLMSISVAAVYFYAAGVAGVLAFLVAAALGKAYLEATNYIEHYGLVRVPGQKVEARHSWDSYRKLTGAFLYNLPRHADHHLHANKPFWELKAVTDAPQLPYGYQAMMLLALAPPRYFAVMAPLLSQWDQTLASDGERRLIG